MTEKKILKTDGGGQIIKDPKKPVIQEPKKKVLPDGESKKKSLND